MVKPAKILTQNETVISQKSEQRYIKCQYSHVKQNCKCLVKCLKLSVLMFFVDHQHRKSSDVICVIGSLLSGHDFNSVKDKVWGRIKTFNCSIHQPEQKYRWEYEYPVYFLCLLDSLAMLRYSSAQWQCIWALPKNIPRRATRKNRRNWRKL